MTGDLRQRLTAAAGAPERGPDPGQAIRRGTMLRWRRRAAASVGAVIVVVGVGVGLASFPFQQSEAPVISDPDDPDASDTEDLDPQLMETDEVLPATASPMLAGNLDQEFPAGSAGAVAVVGEGVPVQPGSDLAPQVPFVVRNRISQPVLGVKVEVELFDARGEPLLTATSPYTYPNVIEPGAVGFGAVKLPRDLDLDAIDRIELRVDFEDFLPPGHLEPSPDDDTYQRVGDLEIVEYERHDEKQVTVYLRNAHGESLEAPLEAAVLCVADGNPHVVLSTESTADELPTDAATTQEVGLHGYPCASYLIAGQARGDELHEGNTGWGR